MKTIGTNGQAFAYCRCEASGRQIGIKASRFASPITFGANAGLGERRLTTQGALLQIRIALCLSHYFSKSFEANRSMQDVSHQDQTGGLCCIIEQRICLRPCKLAIRFLIANDHLHAREVSVLGSIPIMAMYCFDPMLWRWRMNCATEPLAKSAYTKIKATD